MEEMTQEQAIGFLIMEKIHMVMATFVVYMALGGFGDIEEESALLIAEAIGGILEGISQSIESGEIFEDPE